MTIKLHIDRLILDGLPVTSSQAPLMQAAIEAQLTRLLSREGLNSKLTAGSAMAFVKAGDIHLKNSTDLKGLGQQIGGAIYSGIVRK